MRLLTFLLMSALTTGLALAQTATPPNSFAPEPQTFPLWEQGAPGALGSEDRDQPALTMYPPAGRQANGTAIIVAPGGSYSVLASNHEGRQVAHWLNALGVTSFVL